MVIPIVLPSAVRFERVRGAGLGGGQTPFKIGLIRVKAMCYLGGKRLADLNAAPFLQQPHQLAELSDGRMNQK